MRRQIHTLCILLTLTSSSCATPRPPFQLLHFNQQNVYIFLRGVESPKEVSIVGDPAVYTYDDSRDTFSIESATKVLVGPSEIRLENGEIHVVRKQEIESGSVGAPSNYVLDEDGTLEPGFIPTFR
jgi:hypothetical protein